MDEMYFSSLHTKHIDNPRMKETSKVISIIAKKMCGIFSLAFLPLGTCPVRVREVLLELPIIGLYTS